MGHRDSLHVQYRVLLVNLIIVIGSIKSTIKAKKVSVKPSKTTVSEAKPTNSKVTSHGSSTGKDMPLVDP